MSRQEIKFNTPHQIDKLNKILDILEELKDYKPLTLRQIYYQLVAREYIENNVSQYTMLSMFLKWARIRGHVPWDFIEDRVRSHNHNEGWSDKDSFIHAHLRNVLSGYRRNVLQSQDVYLEIWIEKDALSSIFNRAARGYGVNVTVCRGFSSISFLNDFRERLDYVGTQKPLMLYFGDFDPSGMEMLTAMKTTLRDELGVNNIEFKRIALRKEHIEEYELPHNPNAIKKTDTRYAKHKAQYGEIAVELDALSPPILERMILSAIENEIDIDRYKTEFNQQRMDRINIEKLREEIVSFAEDFEY